MFTQVSWRSYFLNINQPSTSYGIIWKLRIVVVIQVDSFGLDADWSIRLPSNGNNHNLAQPNIIFVHCFIIKCPQGCVIQSLPEPHKPFIIPLPVKSLGCFWKRSDIPKNMRWKTNINIFILTSQCHIVVGGKNTLHWVDSELHCCTVLGLYQSQYRVFANLFEYKWTEL